MQNPTPKEALKQKPRAKREIAISSHDNLADYTGNTAELPDMSLPPLFIPPGKKAGERARTKTSLTMTTQGESPMETDAPSATEVMVIPPVPSPRTATAEALNKPCLVDEAGMVQS